MLDIASITDKYVNLFLGHVKRLADLNRINHRTSKNGGFPVFMIDNREFYEQSYFDQLIENTIWRYLINGVFHELFTPEFCTSSRIIIEWPYIPIQLTATSYIEVIETSYCFVEFIVTRNGKREGYRYTNCYYNTEKMQKMFDAKNIDLLYVIDFSSAIQSSFLHPLHVPPKFDGLIHRIPLKDFFCEFFTEEEYKIYSDKVSEAVKEAYQYVGKQTFTNLTYQELFYFRKETLTKLIDFAYTTKQYAPTKKLKKDAILWYGSGVLPKADLKIIQKEFFDTERYKGLVGKKDFAKSFITSEYLYDVIKNNNIVDFTATVTGYFKSIEQLLYLILNSIENDNNSGDVWIQSTIRVGTKKFKQLLSQGECRQTPGKISRTQVRIKPYNSLYYDTSFAALVYMLKDYKDGWIVSPTAKDYISALLLTYSDECRNEHLHKDNIDNPQEIIDIRDKTFLLLFYVLGGFNFPKNSQDEKTLLGVIDNSFETFYQKLYEYGPGNYYYLSFESNSPILTALPMQQDTPIYDKNGLLTNGSLRFVKIHRKNLDDWHRDDWVQIEAEDADDRIIIIDRNNIPSSVTYIDKVSGKTIEVKW